VVSLVSPKQAIHKAPHRFLDENGALQPEKANAAKCFLTSRINPASIFAPVLKKKSPPGGGLTGGPPFPPLLMSLPITHPDDHAWHQSTRDVPVF